MSESRAAPGNFVYMPEFLTPGQNGDVWAFLDGVPRLNGPSSPMPGALAFRHPAYGGVTVTSRQEAAAGCPIWLEQAVAGPAMAEPLVELRDRVSARLRASPASEIPSRLHADLTSVYVDHYQRGGAFSLHTDRDCYGELVAGVSVGDAVGTLFFVNRNDPHHTCEFRIMPRSLYAFFGELRWSPWEHGFRVEQGSTRYALTFRSASGHSSCE